MITALLVAVSGGLVPAHGAEGPAPRPVVRQPLSTGHADLVSVFLDEGRLVVAGQADVDRVATRSDPARTTVRVTDAAARPAPCSPAYAFLGVPAGATIHVLPQAFRQDVLWAGWNTEAVPPGAPAGDAVDITLRSARGPGHVEVYFTGADGPERVFSSRDAGVRTRRAAVPAHAHANWAFTAPGVYELEFTASATTASGAPLVSAPTRYVVAVGPHATTATSTALDVGETGGEIQLSATATGGPPHLDGGVPTGWAEFTRHHADRDEVVGHSALDGGHGVLSLPDVPGALAFTARFVPAIGDLVAPSQSPAVANPRAPPGAVVTGVRDRYATGETITATALITPERPDHTASWWTRADDRVTDRGTGPTLTLPATADLDGALLGFDVRDLRGRVVATARAVPLAVAPAPPTTTAPDPAPTPPPPPPLPAHPRPRRSRPPAPPRRPGRACPRP